MSPERVVGVIMELVRERIPKRFRLRLDHAAQSTSRQRPPRRSREHGVRVSERRRRMRRPRQNLPAASQLRRNPNKPARVRLAKREARPRSSRGHARSSNRPHGRLRGECERRSNP